MLRTQSTSSLWLALCMTFLYVAVTLLVTGIHFVQHLPKHQQQQQQQQHVDCGLQSAQQLLMRQPADGAGLPVQKEPPASLAVQWGSKAHALAPWVSSAKEPPGCVLLHVGAMGLGSTLNFVILATMLLLQQYPRASILLDASPFQSICPGGLGELLVPLTPAVAGASNTNSGCKAWGHSEMVDFVRSYTSKAFVDYVGFNNGAAFFHQVSQLEMPLHARLRHKEIWDAVWHATCPVMRKFWRLSQPLQQRVNEVRQASKQQAPLVALHVRGGDKLAPSTREVPANFDYSFDRGINTVAEQLAVAAAAAAAGHTASNATSTLHRPHCIMMGDDAQLIETVRQKVASVLQCSQLTVRSPAGSVRPFDGGSPNQARCATLSDMVVEMDLLASANFTIGTMWSNFDSVAYYAAMCVYNRSAETYVDGSASFYGPYV